MSSANAASRSSPRAILEAAGWGQLQERLLAGLVHSFRGRATALSGLALLVRDGDEGNGGFQEHMEEELQRLQKVVEDLSLLTGDPASEPEPLNPTEAVPPVLRLWSGASGDPLPVTLRGDGSPPPVRVGWSYFPRALLLLLRWADGVYRSRDAREIRLALTGEGNGAVFDLLPDRTPGTGSPEAAILIPEEQVREMDTVWAWMGGEVDIVEDSRDGGPMIRARLPGLSVTR